MCCSYRHNKTITASNRKQGNTRKIKNINYIWEICQTKRIWSSRQKHCVQRRHHIKQHKGCAVESTELQFLDCQSTETISKSDGNALRWSHSSCNMNSVSCYKHWCSFNEHAEVLNYIIQLQMICLNQYIRFTVLFVFNISNEIDLLFNQVICYR